MKMQKIRYPCCSHPTFVSFHFRFTCTGTLHWSKKSVQNGKRSSKGLDKICTAVKQHYAIYVVEILWPSVHQIWVGQKWNITTHPGAGVAILGQNLIHSCFDLLIVTCRMSITSTKFTLFHGDLLHREFCRRKKKIEDQSRLARARGKWLEEKKWTNTYNFILKHRSFWFRDRVFSCTEYKRYVRKKACNVYSKSTPSVVASKTGNQTHLWLDQWGWTILDCFTDRNQQVGS